VILVKDAAKKRLPAIEKRACGPPRFAKITPLALLTAASLLSLIGCGATRPSKYYQLTVPGEQTATQNADPAAATLLLGPLLASHLYREDRIVTIHVFI